MSLAAEDLQRLARLARLRFADTDAERYRDELNTILDMVDTLKAAETDGVTPMAHPLDMAQRLRPDAATESDQRAELMKAAAQTENGLFVVPRVIE